MAILEAATSVPLGLTSHAPPAPGHVRLAVHDASRLEWSFSVPLPREGALGYELELEMTIPENAFAPHAPWDQLQAFTRLDGPAMSVVADDVASIDALRRGALAVASKLSRARDGFSRHCRLAGSLFTRAHPGELEEGLVVWIEAALALVVEGRSRLVRPRRADAEELARERHLVDEYLSVRLLETLAVCERSLSALLQARGRGHEDLGETVGAVEARLAEALENEVEHRDERGYVHADPSHPAALEHYIERASRLKKHFQEVLFLEAETVQIAERAYHWVAGFVALCASIWAFIWQVALTNQANTAAGQGISSGLVTVALVAGLVYATKDRFKEIGRNWIARHMHRFYGAQRVTRYRAPSKRLPGRDVVAIARESFDQRRERLVDPLNADAGATVPVTRVLFRQRGTALAKPELLASGVTRIKHVFRYDLSPIFTRLDDATKPVPVLDEATRRVCFVDAPKCYRVPVRVRVRCAGEPIHDESATLIVHKRGLERLERLERDGGSDPSLAELALDPA